MLFLFLDLTSVIIQWLEVAKLFGKEAFRERLKSRIQETLQKKLTIIFPGYTDISWITQIVAISISGWGCSVSSVCFSFLVFELQVFDDLCISFKIDCEKQNNKSKSAVMLRIAMQRCEKVKHTQTLYKHIHNSF